MALEVIQYLGIIFGLAGFVSSTFRFRNRNIQAKEYIFWGVVWASIIVFSFLPELSVQLASAAGINRGSDLLMYVGILMLFYLLFRLYAKVEKLNKSVTQIVRVIAVDNGKDKKKH